MKAISAVKLHGSLLLQATVPYNFDWTSALEKGLDQPLRLNVRLWSEAEGHNLAGLAIGRFTFAALPGCCGVVVSTDSFLDKHPMNIGPDFHRLKAQVAKLLGYSAMLSTTQCRNVQEVVGGAKAGWKWLEPFKNTRTNNELFFGIKLL